MAILSFPLLFVYFAHRSVLLTLFPITLVNTTSTGEYQHVHLFFTVIPCVSTIYLMSKLDITDVTNIHRHTHTHCYHLLTEFLIFWMSTVLMWTHTHTYMHTHTHTVLSFAERVPDFLDVSSADVNTHTHTHTHTLVSFPDRVPYFLDVSSTEPNTPPTHARTHAHTHTHTLLSFADRVPDFLDVGSTDVLHPTPVGANLSIKEHPLLLPLLLLLGPADKQNQGSETSLHQVNH